jgi:hypothetical protein
MRLAALALLFASALLAQPLRDAVRARIGDFPGTVSLYARNLDTGASLGIREGWNASERFRSEKIIPQYEKYYEGVVRAAK